MPIARQNFDLPAAGRSLGQTASSFWDLPLAGLGHQKSSRWKIRQRDLAFILRNLATLVHSGLPLPKAIATLARERSLLKHRDLLHDLRQEVETGESFSETLAGYPSIFNELLVSQIRAGERAGTLADALERVAGQLEKATKVRSNVIRKLTYPAVLTVGGGLAVTFMLVFVIPIFEETYAEAKVPLPTVTRLLIASGRYLASYGWIALAALAAAGFAVRRARKQPALAARMDRAVLRVPVIGDFLRNMAVLQFMEVFGNLIDSGFKLVEALEVSTQSIGNRSVRRSVRELHAAVTRGERFGRELDQMGDLFPPVVSQLIAVGERSGNLPGAMAHIREHLEQEIDRQTNMLVGTIEPTLTIGLAAVIAMILLAIYVPMFDMIGAVGGAG
jgi:type IV pilus assembly protein PilC